MIQRSGGLLAAQGPKDLRWQQIMCGLKLGSGDEKLGSWRKASTNEESRGRSEKLTKRWK